jgi:intracellular septation protein A
MSDAAKARDFFRKNVGSFGVEAVVNIVLPFAVYSYAKPQLGDVKALLASMIPPIAWSIFEFARKRRIDSFSIIIVLGIALSLLAFLGGGSVKFLQLRENLVTGVIGLVFLGSAAIGKPLIYELARAGAQRRASADVQFFERMKDNVNFRRVMTLMTIVWGVGLVAETGVACALVFAMSIQAYLVVSPIVGYGWLGALALWTYWYGKRQRRIGDARRAAAAAAAGSEPPAASPAS